MGQLVLCLRDIGVCYSNSGSGSGIQSRCGRQSPHVPMAVRSSSQAFSISSLLTFRRDTADKVPTVMAATLADIRAANKAGASPAYAGLFVVYDLPDRDCAAAASNGEYSIANNGLCVSKFLSLPLAPA